MTPAVLALRSDNATMSGYSMPIARAPRLAAVMTRPSPEPRSITKSWGVTLAMSSILSTSVCGVGTQTTSFAGLTDLRLERLLPRLRPGVGGTEGHDERGDHETNGSTCKIHR